MTTLSKTTKIIQLNIYNTVELKYVLFLNKYFVGSQISSSLKYTRKRVTIPKKVITVQPYTWYNLTGVRSCQTQHKPFTVVFMKADDHEAILEQLRRAHENRHDDSCWTDIEEVIAKVERIVAHAKNA